jgi:hypothetical protein
MLVRNSGTEPVIDPSAFVAAGHRRDTDSQDRTNSAHQAR